MAIESASRFKSARVSVSTQWRSSKITISGWRIDSEEHNALDRIEGRRTSSSRTFGPG